MKKLGLLLFSLLSLATTSTTKADYAYPLCTVTTDASPLQAQIRLLINKDNEITGMSVKDSNNLYYRFTLEQLSAGTPLIEVGGFDLVTIYANKLDRRNGGKLLLKYLYNLTPPMKYRTQEIELTRIGQQWALSVDQKLGRKEFNSMFFKRNTGFFNQTIGTKEIIFSYN